MALDVEGVVDGGVRGEEPLGGTLGFELLLLSLPSPDRQVGVLRPIVLPQAAWPVTIRAADFAGRGWVRLEPRAVVVLDLERLMKRGR